MLSVKIDAVNHIAMLEPHGALSKSDFESAVEIIDPHIESTGHLKGVIIHTKSFPGWDSFAALAAHLKFVKNHHRKVSCLAFVTDSVVGNIAESIGSHFVSAKVKLFPFSEMDKAKAWILENA